MATLTSEGIDLVLALSRLEKLGAFHGDIRVPLTAVERVDVSAAPFRELRGLRAPGTGVPRRIALGTWRRRDGKDFAALRGRRPGVVVHLREGQFRRLLVSADDAEGVAASIQAAAGISS
jgi:hypothetical protein